MIESPKHFECYDHSGCVCILASYELTPDGLPRPDIVGRFPWVGRIGGDETADHVGARERAEAHAAYLARLKGATWGVSYANDPIPAVP